MQGGLNRTICWMAVILAISVMFAGTSLYRSYCGMKTAEYEMLSNAKMIDAIVEQTKAALGETNGDDCTVEREARAGMR